MFDTHLDLAWSAMYFNRDLREPIAAIRAAESGLKDEPGRGRNTVSFPDLRRAQVHVCVTSLLARSAPEFPRTGSNRANLDYAAQTISHSHAKGQLAYYRLLESLGEVRILQTSAELQSHWNSRIASASAGDPSDPIPGEAATPEVGRGSRRAIPAASPQVQAPENKNENSTEASNISQSKESQIASDVSSLSPWERVGVRDGDLANHSFSTPRPTETEAPAPIGLIISMEGADPILNPSQVEHWWQQGLRAVGPVHYGHSHYAVGTGFDGPLTPAGRDLLKKFMELGMILDVTHLSDTSFFQALELYNGPVLASHHNCRALVPGDRQLTDEQIRILIERDAIIGTAFDAWMLYPNWQRGITQPAVVGLQAAADHIDHICQLAGNSSHCAFGTDLDGGFGTEQTPRDLDTIADIHKLEQILADRGYKPTDIDAIFSQNALRFWTQSLP